MKPAGTRVLVVDDDDAFRSVLAELLAAMGHEVAQAASADEALARTEEGSFPVVVVDLVLPDLGGIELADRIKAQSPDTQILILTGHGDKQSAIEGLQRGAFDYLEKGALDIPRLARSIAEAAERSRLLAENRELLARLQESNRLLKALHDMATTLTGEPHLDRLLQNLVAAAKELCRAATGRVVLFGRTHGEGFIIEGSEGDGAETIRGARLHPNEGLATLSLEKNEPVLVSQPKAHPRYSPRCDEMPTLLPGFLCAPLRHGSASGVVMVAGRPTGEFTAEDRDLFALLAREAAVGIDNALAHERSINFFTHASQILVSFLEKMDILYPGHSQAVAALADMVTRRLGLSDDERRHIHFAALLHDIGKAQLDPAILTGNDSPSAEERRLLEEHPFLGVQLLRPITVWEDILPIIHSHHERWDGKGYPRGLTGEEIPIGARVIAVADAFDAMTRQRPHGPQRSPEEALAELEACASTQFDPRVVRLFLAEYRRRGDQIPP